MPQGMWTLVGARSDILIVVNTKHFLSLARIRVDETSFQKCHEYVIVMTNIDNSCVIAVMNRRIGDSLSIYLGLFDFILTNILATR